ncbi:MAG: site-specific integrase [Pseudomonadota bacterium]
MPKRSSGPRLVWRAERSQYEIQWFERGKRKRRSTGCSSTDGAHRVFRSFLAEYQAKKSGRLTLVADILLLYYQNRQDDTNRRLRSFIKALASFWDGKHVEEVTETNCRLYVQHRGKSAGTIRRELQVLSSALNRAYHEQKIDRPIKLWLPPSPPPRQRWLTQDEFARLLDATSTPHIKLFMMIGIYTGARTGAILDLQWGQIDFENRRIDFNPPGRIQTKKRRPIVPIAQPLYDALQATPRIADHVVTYNGKQVRDIKRGFQRAARRAQLEGVSAHTLRHTCATWLIRARVPPYDVARFLGHSTVRMIEQVYGHHAPDYLDGIENKLPDFGDGLGQ